MHLAGNSGRPRDPAEALSAMLRASGQDPHTIPEPLEDRAAAFRGRMADRKMLLVLDDAADADQVRPLLPGTAGIAVLITSRSDLRGPAVSHMARTVPLDVLAPAEARSPLAGALGAGRVSGEAEAAERPAALCARLPPALRIAAANLAARPGWSLTDYAAELAGDGRPAKLSVEGDRRAAVRAAFDHSYTALEPDTARLFGLLGLHPGPDFIAEAAAALLDSPPAVAERLLDAAGLPQHTVAGRLRFHDLPRLYAAEHAAADPDRATVWQRLYDWYLATTDAAIAFGCTGSVQLPRPRAVSDRFADRHRALAWLEGERANLVAVITHAAEAGPRPIAWQLADQLRPYFHRRRHQPEWEAATTAGLRAVEREGEVLARAAMRHGFFLLRRHAGDIPAALEAVHLALEGYRRAGFAPGEGTILTNLALHHGQRGQMRHALGWQQAGIANARSLGWPISLGRGLNMAGLIHSYLGELDQALVCTTEAIETHVRAGHRSFVISPRTNRAIAHHALGRYEEALADGTEALRLCRSHQQQHSEAGAHEISPGSVATPDASTSPTRMPSGHCEEPGRRATRPTRRTA
ncbi:hypothetical protein ACWCQE_33265 [Streptomyces sp. NPDC002409]